MNAVGKVTYREPEFTAVRDHEQSEDTIELQNPSEYVDRVLLPLGDWVEIWAKPIGCWLDRTTKRLPWQLVKIRIDRGRIYTTLPRPRWQRLLLACRLSASFRTQFCGCSACSKRRRFLNLLIPDMRSATCWIKLCRHPARVLSSAFQATYRPVP